MAACHHGQSGSHEGQDTSFHSLSSSPQDLLINNFLESASSFVKLSIEIILVILQNLQPFDLNSMSLTYHKLRTTALDDILWKPHILANLPDSSFLSSPSPFESYHELYWSHDPHWFVAKRMVWIGEDASCGSLLVTGFNPSTGHIQGYEVCATMEDHPSFSSTRWECHLFIQTNHFDPIVQIEQTPVFDIPPKNWFDEGTYKTSPETIN